MSTKVQEYTSKANAVRGAQRMGLDKAEAERFATPKNGGYMVDRGAVELYLAQKQGAAHQEVSDNKAVLSDEDKRQIADEARIRAQQGNDTPQDEIDNDLVAYCGYSECPHCGIHLSNGVCDFDSMVDTHGSEKAAYKIMKHEFCCLGCNGEWGKAITPKGAKPRGEPTRHYLNRSDAELKAKGGAVGVAWDIFSANLDLRRKDAIQKAVDAGVAFYTARTQYQKWFTARKGATK